MDNIIPIIIFSAFMFFLYTLDSKAKTKKAALLEGLGQIANFGGNMVSTAGEILKEASIESEIKRIDLGCEFKPKFQASNSVLIIYAILKFESFQKNEISETQKVDLLNRGILQDKLISNNVYQNTDFYTTCKNLEIESVLIWGCTIYKNGDFLKKSELIKSYTVGKFSLNEK